MPDPDIDPESFSIPLRTPAHPPPPASSDVDPEQSSVSLRSPPRSLMGTSWKTIGKEAFDPLSGAYLGGDMPPPDRVVGLETPPGWERQPFLPLAGNPTTGERAPAIPGFISGLMTEGPQIKDGNLTVPGVTIDPATSRLGLTPEASAAASVFGNSLLRFGPRARGPGPGGRDLAVPEDAAVQREFDQPPTPSLPTVMRQQRALIPPDPATQAAIDILQRAAQSGKPGIPTPPTPFRGAPYQPPPSGGLLDIPGRAGPTPANAEAMTKAEMLGTSKGYYSPADRQAAQGVTINPDHSNGIRQPLLDALPTDPEKAGYVGDNSLIRLAKVAQDNQGNPMSFDTAMSLDKELTARRQEAYVARNYTLASQIEDAQDAIRAKMQSLPDNATTGDASTLARLPQARQAYSQAMKQGQLEDIAHDAGLLSDDKQNAYIRTRVTAMLRNPRKMAGWLPDEKAQLEEQLKSGNIGSLTNFGISLIKPFGTAVGGTAGSVFGPGGAFVGGQAGGEAAAALQNRIRTSLQKITLDPVTRRLTANMPPPP